MGKHTGIKIATVYGGQGMGIQLDALHRGVEIIVATPGRLIDHLKRGSIELGDITHIVLDEADTMLDMGFVDDIQFILDLSPEDRVMSLFSATMPTCNFKTRLKIIYIIQNNSYWMQMILVEKE